MKFFLNLNMRNMEGVLERVLGVVRLRGFRVCEMTAHSTSDSENLDVTLKVESNRNGENLQRQLNKLMDVSSVEMFTIAPAASPVHAGYPMAVAAAG